jgi:hypothetical protein
MEIKRKKIIMEQQKDTLEHQNDQDASIRSDNSWPRLYLENRSKSYNTMVGT